MSLLKHLIPKAEVSRWTGPGLHDEVDGHTEVNGWSLCFAWVGLHFEFVIATESRS